ncbi:MAG: SH3 domain-containing protein [Deltaproteobacteria bacterium]|nr:SH3 domain-containing protein [Deltaproteobacteria bacterium]
MYLRRSVPWIVFLAWGLFVTSHVLAQAKYVRITGNRVNIRAGPSTSFPVVAKARKGDVFELLGKEGRWYRVRMFSMRHRYVHRSLAEVVAYSVSIPKVVSLRRKIFGALLRAEERAGREADRRYPVEERSGRPLAGNTKRNSDYFSLLSDRYKLMVMHRFKVQPPLYDVLMGEGVRRNW